MNGPSFLRSKAAKILSALSQSDTVAKNIGSKRRTAMSSKHSGIPAAAIAAQNLANGLGSEAKDTQTTALA